jgi:hypothetical protein
MKEDFDLDVRLHALADHLGLSEADQRNIERLSSIPRLLAQASRDEEGSRRIRSTLWSSNRRPMRWAAVAAVTLTAFIGGNFAAAYYSPRYGAALAQAPLLGAVSDPVLRAAGLTPESLLPLESSATSSGHTIRLVGGYSDPTRTVLILEVDGQAPSLPSKASRTYYIDGYLTDQFGHMYQQASGPEQGVASRFEPLVWPASSLGARLTLHVSQLRPNWKTGTAIAGAWTLHATLTQRPGHALPIPAPIAESGMVYTFTSLRSSSRALEVKWSARGPAVDRIREVFPSALNASQGAARSQASDELRTLDEEYLWPHLLDAAGRPLPLTNFGFNFGLPGSSGAAQGELDVFLPGPGLYRISFGTGTVSRVVEVPAD